MLNLDYLINSSLIETFSLLGEKVQPFVYAKPDGPGKDAIQELIQAPLMKKAGNGILSQSSLSAARVPRGNLHCTIMFSMSQVPMSLVNEALRDDLTFKMKVEEVELFANDKDEVLNLVLRVSDHKPAEGKAHTTQARHDLWKSIGCEWKFPEYKAHITLFKDFQEHLSSSADYDYKELKRETKKIVKEFNIGLDKDKGSNMPVINMTGEFFRDKLTQPSQSVRL